MSNEQAVYRKLKDDPTKEFKKEIDALLQDAVMHGTIPVELQRMLENDNPRVPILYLVPKVHKDLTHPPLSPYSFRDWVYIPTLGYICGLIPAGYCKRITPLLEGHK